MICVISLVTCQPCVGNILMLLYLGLAADHVDIYTYMLIWFLIYSCLVFQYSVLLRYDISSVTLMSNSIVFIFCPTRATVLWMVQFIFTQPVSYRVSVSARYNRQKLLGWACQYACVGGLIFRRFLPVCKIFFIGLWLLLSLVFIWIISIVYLLLKEEQGCVFIESSYVKKSQRCQFYQALNDGEGVVYYQSL